MKFVLFGRLKKEGAKEAQNAAQPARASDRPAAEERVSFLLSQGLAEPEIIKAMKEEGYSFQEIDSGVSNMLKSRVSDEAPMQSAYGSQEMPPEDLAPLIGPAEAGMQTRQETRAEVLDQMEAVMEQMIEEKFSSVSAQLDGIDAKFEALEKKIQQLASRINEIEGSEKKYNEGEEVKIQELNAKESGLEPRISSLERAFKDIIPNLVESIRELKEMAASKKREVPLSEEEISEEMRPNEKGAPHGRTDNIFD